MKSLEHLADMIELMLKDIEILKEERTKEFIEREYKDKSYHFASFDPYNYEPYKDEKKFIDYFFKKFNEVMPEDDKYTKTIYEFYLYSMSRYFRIAFPICILDSTAKKLNIN